MQAIVRCILVRMFFVRLKYADPQNPNSNQLPAKRRLHQQCQNVNGTVLWYAKSVVDNPGNYGTLLRTNYWRYPALQPLMPFIDDEAPSKPKKVKARQESDGYYYLTWKAPKGEGWKDAPYRYIVYRFYAGEPINLDDPQRLWGCLTAISYVLIIKTAVQNTSMSLLLLTE